MEAHADFFRVNTLNNVLISYIVSNAVVAAYLLQTTPERGLANVRNSYGLAPDGSAEGCLGRLSRQATK